MLKLVAVFKKEIKTFLCSPVALVFFGAYLLATLFSFFWIEKFFPETWPMCDLYLSGCQLL